jgi:hypothetical protein
MASYLAFENAVPYAGGLPNSYLLASQASFWKSLGAACGNSFLSDINKQAGSTEAQFSAGFQLGGKGVAGWGIGLGLATWFLI